MECSSSLQVESSAISLCGGCCIVVIFTAQVVRKAGPSLQLRDGPAWHGLGGCLSGVCDGGKLLVASNGWGESNGGLAPSLLLWLGLVILLFVAGVTGAHCCHSVGFVWLDGVLGLVVLGGVSDWCQLVLSSLCFGRFAVLACLRHQVVVQLLESGWAGLLFYYSLIFTLAVETATSIAGVSNGAGGGWSGLLLVLQAVSLAAIPPFDLLESEAEVVGGFHSEWGGISFLAAFLFTSLWVAILLALLAGSLFSSGGSPLADRQLCVSSIICCVLVSLAGITFTRMDQYIYIWFRGGVGGFAGVLAGMISIGV